MNRELFIKEVLKLNIKLTETMLEQLEKYYQILVNDPELSALRASIKKTHTIGLCMTIFAFLSLFVLGIISLAILIAGVFIMNSKKKLKFTLAKLG